MGANSHIQWTDHTFNPWDGCTKVSAGCKHCYAETRNLRFAAGANWGKGAPRRRTSAANWRLPLRWNQIAKLADEFWDAVQDPSCPSDVREGVLPYHRPRVFCASLADWLDDEVPIEWLADLLQLIHDTPNLDWLLLTKRPENWETRVRNAVPTDPAAFGWRMAWLNGHAPANVWIGASVEGQENADRRIPELLKIPARVRFLSCEPLLSDVDLFGCDTVAAGSMPKNSMLWPSDLIHWVIVGGESGFGDKCRECDLAWIRSLIEQCESAGVPVFVKQLGSRRTNSAQPDGDLAQFAFTHPKGGDIAEWPEDLRVRRFPSP
jgi:protein gp37